jgi:hypothetical protein
VDRTFTERMLEKIRHAGRKTSAEGCEESTRDVALSVPAPGKTVPRFRGYGASFVPTMT